jgi:hypothetical protein
MSLSRSMSCQPEMTQQSEPMQREPMQREPMQSEPMQSEPMQRIKNKIFVPPMRYELIPLTQYQTLSDISKLSKNFANLPQDLVDWIYYDVNSRPYTFFGAIPALQSDDLNKQIIGVEGYYFKLTTQNTGVDFIWHDYCRNEFQFWGDYYCCIRAMNEIRYRTCKFARQNIATMSLPSSPMPVIFENDVNPHPAVVLEAHLTCDENGEVINSVSKIYPDTE